MRLEAVFLSLLAVLAERVEAEDGSRIVFVVIPYGKSSFDRGLAKSATVSIESQIGSDEKISFVSSESIIEYGHHTIWLLLKPILESYPAIEWVIFTEPETTVDVEKVRLLLKSMDPLLPYYTGSGLVDKEPVIIHHYHGFGSEERLEYPDLHLGMVMSRELLVQLIAALAQRSASSFAIDVKHESCKSRQSVDYRNVFVAIKTFSGNHKTRVVKMKRTWVKNAKTAEFYSNKEDPYVPTRTVGVNNTNKGHCAKTFAIMKDVLENKEMKESIKWVLVADDDTLVGLSRLYRLLRCYDHKEKVIIGERYGMGYTQDGRNGYNYPTGGSGMVFSIPAVKALVANCQCPAIDSPDDMIIGLCAKNLEIPISHSAAFHQARARDYPSVLLSRLPPISLHKFDKIDPYEDYMEYLHEAEDDVNWNIHTEL